MAIILFRILMAVEFLVCLLLIGLVLMQRSKGQGVGLSFGGGAEAIFGAQMGNVLTRFTVILGIVFLVNTTILAVMRPTGNKYESDSLVLQDAVKEQTSGGRVQAPATVVDDEDLYNVLDSALPEAPAPAPAPVVVVVDEVDEEDTVDNEDTEDAVDAEAAADGE